MKTILEAIKIYNKEFITTLKCRAETTPSAMNRENHLSLISYIEQRDYHNIGLQILEEWYQKPLEGVIFCLKRYSGMDKEVWMEIVQLWEDGKLV